MEQRLIDANPIYDKVEANYRMSEGVQHVCEREFLNLICDAPTVDAVPVVRCKDCLWRHDDSSPTWLPCMGRETPDDWFCADGERRNNGK